MTRGATILLAATGLLLVSAPLWLRRQYIVVTVEGSSMEPTYRDQDRVLVRRVRAAAVRSGQVIVIAGAGPGEDPRWMLKRAVAVPGDPMPRTEAPALRDVPESAVPAGHLVVKGDNTANSYDSRHFGFLPAESLLGIAVRRITPSRPCRGAGRHGIHRGEVQ